MEPAHGKHSRGNKPTKKKKKRGGCLPVLLVLVLLAVMAAGAVLLAVKGDIDGKGETGQAVSVTVEQGSGVATIANRLKSAGLIKYPRIFRFYVDHKGAAGKLQYGDFNIPEGASYDTIIEHLSQYVAAATTRVTFPEGRTALSIAAKMEEAGLCSAEEFLDVANNGDFSQFKFWQYVPAADTPGLFMRCEGYLFPETYDFYDEDTVYNYVATFYAQFESRITDEMYAELDKQG
ncbi:MAG: endolytic transglycosylase MltG, partial [Faecalibacterium sp.]|nr:endolytic transglycosylase MltG [Faecalibacterium sp.]